MSFDVTCPFKEEVVLAALPLADDKLSVYAATHGEDKMMQDLDDLLVSHEQLRNKSLQEGLEAVVIDLQALFEFTPEESWAFVMSGLMATMGKH